MALEPDRRRAPKLVGNRPFLAPHRRFCSVPTATPTALEEFEHQRRGERHSFELAREFELRGY